MTSPIDAWLVVRRAGESQLRVLLSSTGEEIYRLPLGVPDDTWGSMVTTSPSGAGTIVERAIIQPDPIGQRQTIAGHWHLPTIGLDPTPVGVSAVSGTVVLVEDRPASSGSTGTSRFAVLRGVLDPHPRIVALRGDFSYDALSPDGTILYVAEHLSGPPDGHYQVRAVDVATGVMRDAVIADKRSTEPMSGYPIGQLRRPDGMVFTLYRGAEHPFIHALNTVDAWAVCIDLPAAGPTNDATDWGLVSARGGSSVVAANATLGLAVDVDPTSLSARRATTFSPTAAGSIVLAKFGHDAGGSVGRRVVAAADGGAVFAGGADGVVRLALDNLDVTSRMLAGQPVDALALTPDGSTLFALRHASGSISRIDAGAGQELSDVPGTGYDRLLAVVPW